MPPGKIILHRAKPPLYRVTRSSRKRGPPDLPPLFSTHSKGGKTALLIDLHADGTGSRKHAKAILKERREGGREEREGGRVRRPFRKKREGWREGGREGGINK